MIRHANLRQAKGKGLGGIFAGMSFCMEAERGVEVIIGEHGDKEKIILVGTRTLTLGFDLMKRILATAALLLTGLCSQASAMVGGPFDNGMESLSLSRNSIYQAILSFSNGSGYIYFHPDANIAANGTTAGGATTLGGLGAVATRGSDTNRSVMYYKGITYVGSAFATADFEARVIMGSINAGSNAAQSQLTTQTGNNNGNPFSATGAGANSNAISTTLISNPTSFTVNGEFTCHIDQTAPTVRFSGTGELSFIAPNQKDAQAGLAYTGFSGLVNSIITAVGNANVGVAFSATVFTQAEIAIQNAVAALPPLTSVDEAYAAGQVKKMRLNGTRRYY